MKITDKKYVRYKEGAERYSMGLHTFQELAKEANAIYRVRKTRVGEHGDIRRILGNF